MQTYHVPVMLSEVISGLNIKKDGTYVDCTVGGGGHSFEIAKHLNGGRLICFDRDEDAICAAKQKLAKFNFVSFVHSNFKNAPQVLQEMGISKIDGFLVDLGVSSHQIDDGARGFSFVNDGVLDMRMDGSEQTITAKEIVNTYSQSQLIQIFKEYGEEEFAASIAKNIVLARQEKEIATTFQLKEIIERSMPKKVVFSRGGASKKVFQALRIAVNDELGGLDVFLQDMLKMLKSGGRAVVLSFHSLEDRIVKNVFKAESTGCICPPKTPVCICGHKSTVMLVNKKPIVASIEEQAQNSRSTCAKLRVAQKL